MPRWVRESVRPQPIPAIGIMANLWTRIDRNTRCCAVPCAALLLVVLTGAACADSPAAPAQVQSDSLLPGQPMLNARIVLTGVNVLPLDADRVLESYTVVVDSGRIVALGPANEVTMPEGATVIAARGRWLAPGLVDFHTHEAALPGWPDDTAGNLLMLLANSVTSMVNMGDFTGRLIGVRAAVQNGQLPGPNVYVGQFVRGPGDGGFPVASDAASARAIVEQASDRGYDFLKVYDRVPREAFDALVSAGRAQGLAVLGHVVAPGLWYGLEHGQKMIVHASSFFYSAFGGRVNDADVRAVTVRVRASGAAATATLYVSELIVQFGLDGLQSRDPFARVLAQEGVEFMHDGAIDGWRTMMQERADIRVARDRRAELAFMQRFIRAFHDAGVPILMGSDEIGIPGVVPGFAVHGELRLLRAAGLTPLETMETATRNAGEFVRRHIRPQEQFGTVTKGARADLVLLDGDPRSDLEAFRKPAGVMVAGRWYPGAWLRAQLDSLRTAR
jgi:imidazolonepropionase-like amidohydrolase